VKNILLAFMTSLVVIVTPALADPPNWTSGPFAYDGSSNVVDIGNDRYVYDTAGRLVSATARAVNQQDYVYDSFGNRLSSTTTHAEACAGNLPCDGPALTVAPTTNHILSQSALYDSAGNLTAYEGIRSYHYDPAGMMTSRQDQTAASQYVYTVDDQRIAIYADHAWRWSIRDLAQRVMRDFTSHDTGTSIASAPWSSGEDYIYGTQGLLGTSATGRRHIHLDHLGTPRAITDDSGRLAGEHAYYPFGGEIAIGAENPEERLKFTGHERDDLTPGVPPLDYMHARYYAERMGRFLSVDPVLHADRGLHAPQLWSRYSYALDNPLVYSDPTGATVYVVTYTVGNDYGDDEFLRAAMTHAAQIRSMKGYDSKKDTVVLSGVHNRADFGKALADARSLESRYGRVGELSMFSHAGPDDGPTFHHNVAPLEQFTRDDLKAMSVDWEWWGNAKFW
jgi:RHS repeat-associated protein